MFDWLFEGHTTVYLLLGAALLACLMLYWPWRRKRWLWAMLVVVLFIGVYGLLDRLVETDREQIQRKVQAMAAGVQAHNLDAVFEHVSDNFHTGPSSNKETLRQTAQGPINNVTQLLVWDFRFDGRPERGKDYDGLRFSFKAKGNLGISEEVFFDCHPIFEYDGVKGWRMKSFKILKPGQTDASEIPIPF